MMSAWFEKFDFEKNPYERIDPTRIADKYFVWDRPDLATARKTLDSFVDAISNGRRAGLRIFGPTGSGKTWLARVIQVELAKKQPNTVFFFTRVPRVEPTFAIVYRIAMESFVRDYLPSLTKLVKDKQQGTEQKDWMKVVSDPDLANVLARISNNIDAPLAREWLIGGGVTASDRMKLGISVSIETDYDRLVMLKKMLKEMATIFSSVVLIIDELENAPSKLAPSLGDSMREILDEFSERFGLVCLYTAEKEEIWFDYGYSVALARRIDYTIPLESLKPKEVAEFLRTHQSKYRKPGSKVPDQLIPFVESGCQELLMQMVPEQHYPAEYLPACGDLARALAESKEAGPISSQFVKVNRKPS